MSTRANLLAQLTETVTQLLSVVRAQTRYDVVVSEGWTVKDVLSHLTFWHESFARNVADLAAGRPPVPLKGRLSDLNERGVAEMRACTMVEVLARLAAAQHVIEAHILNPALTLIPYRKGSRDYTPDEHLEIVCKHVQQHLKQIQAAYAAQAARAEQR